MMTHTFASVVAAGKSHGIVAPLNATAFALMKRSSISTSRDEPPKVVTVGPTTLYTTADDVSVVAHTDEADTHAVPQGYNVIRFANPSLQLRNQLPYDSDDSETESTTGLPLMDPWEPRYLTTQYYPTSNASGKMIRNAVTNGIFTNRHRVGTEYEHQLFKVRILTGRKSATAFYESPGSFERNFYHNRVQMPDYIHRDWTAKASKYSKL